jgi:hypothetical protein
MERGRESERDEENVERRVKKERQKDKCVEERKIKRGRLKRGGDWLEDVRREERMVRTKKGRLKRKRRGR